MINDSLEIIDETDESSKKLPKEKLDYWMFDFDVEKDPGSHEEAELQEAVRALRQEIARLERFKRNFWVIAGVIFCSLVLYG